MSNLTNPAEEQDLSGAELDHMEHFDIYGLGIRVSSQCDLLIDNVRRDFSFFQTSEQKCDLSISLFLRRPPYERLPPLPSSFITPRNVCYRHGKTTYIDYFGRALAVVNDTKKECLIYAEDNDLVHEICYLFILSTAGQYLDGLGLHRIHSLGVSNSGEGVLLLLPSGGGKSTTALTLLSHPDFLLLSEDTPLIDRRGTIHPFPLRIGVRPESQHGIAERYLRTVKRMEFDPKTLIDLDAFPGKIGDSVKGKVLLVGQRNLGDISAIEPISRSTAFSAVVKYMVVGLGVYQGLEFLLERGSWELLGKLGLVASRLRNAWALLRSCTTYRFIMGRDIQLNISTLLEFLDQRQSNDHPSG